MSKSTFRFGNFSLGVFTALIWLTPLVFWFYDQWLMHYLGFLVFLGVGLRPLLEYTGLVSLAERLEFWLDEKLNGKKNREARKKVERQRRDDQYRGKRKNDPNLPKNW